VSEIGGGYCRRFRQVKGVGISVDESARDEARVLFGGRGTPMIRNRKRASERIGKRKFPRRRRSPLRCYGLRPERRPRRGR
jgi:hypothetical protein